MKPLVSVIIPTHDRNKLLNLAVNSVLGQSFQDFEIVIVDDVGNAQITTPNKKITDIIRCDSGGKVARSRNIGIEHASGKYIAFLDDDDLWLSPHLAYGMCLMAVHGAGLYFSNMYNVRNHSEPLAKPYLNIPYMHGNLLNSLILNPIVATPTVIVEASLFKKTGGFSCSDDLPVGEDMDMWLRLASVTNACYNPLATVVRLYDPCSHESLTGRNNIDGRASIAQFKATRKVFERLFASDIPAGSKLLALVQALNYQGKINAEILRGCMK